MVKTFVSVIPALFFNITVHPAYIIGPQLPGGTGFYAPAVSGSFQTYSEFPLQASGRLIHGSDAASLLPDDSTAHINFRGLFTIVPSGSSSRGSVRSLIFGQQEDYLEVHLEGRAQFSEEVVKVTNGLGGSPVQFGEIQNAVRVTFRSSTSNSAYDVFDNGLYAASLTYAPGGRDKFFAGVQIVKIVQEKQKFNLFDIPKRYLPQNWTPGTQDNAREL